MRILPGLVVAAILSGQVPAQQPGPEPAAEVPKEQQCSVEGTVVDEVTGQGLKNARVSIIPVQPGVPLTGPPPGVRSEDSGQFTLSGLVPGRYRLMVSRDGYAGSGMSPGMPQAVQLISLSPGEKLKNVTLRLTPGAVISGRILDETGEPVIGAMIHVLRQATEFGRRTFVPATRGDQSNDLGEYRIHSLPPGKYYLSVQVNPGRSVPTASSPTEQQEGYVMTFYPNALSPAQAQLLEVRPGERLEGMDFAIHPVPVRTVTGVVKDARTGQPPHQAFVQLVPADTGDGASRLRGFGGGVDAKGAFRIGGVMPGAYTLVARSSMSARESVTGRLAVSVGEENVSGLELLVTPGGTIKGGVRVEKADQPQPDAPDPLKNMRIFLRPEDPVLGPFGMMPPVPDENGGFELFGVHPGSYRVSPNLPPGFYLKRVKFGDQTSENNRIQVPDGFTTGTLELLVSPNSATIGGTLLDKDQKPVSQGPLLVVPDFDKPEDLDTDRIVPGQSDQRGGFEIRGVPPGKYRVLGFRVLEPGRSRDPELIAQAAGRAEKVEVQEKDRKQVTVRAVEQEE